MLTIYIPPGVDSRRELRGRIDRMHNRDEAIRYVCDMARIRSTRSGDIVLNWGGGSSSPLGAAWEPIWETETRFLNRPAAVDFASDKVFSTRQLGKLAPPSVFSPIRIPFLPLPWAVVAKKRRTSHSRGVRLLPRHSARRLGEYDYWQQYIVGATEYRVNIVRGHVLTCFRKLGQWGLFSFEAVAEDDIPPRVVARARAALFSLGLQFAGIDVLHRERDNLTYVLEANTAPGMSTATLRALVAWAERRV